MLRSIETVLFQQRLQRPRGRSIRIATVVLGAYIALVNPILADPAAAGERRISCLGRLEPGLGVVRLASPAEGGGVIASLAVSEGEWVEHGQILATLNDHALRKAEVARLEAERRNALRDAERMRRLSSRSVASGAKLDAAEMDLRIADANLDAARARVELTQIRAPIVGQILEIHARPGERVRADGVLEMGDTKNMVAVAEVYETDIGSVVEGQRAIIHSSALEAPLSGIVAGVGLKVGRMDVLGTDPVAKADARVIEVRIKLDSSEAVARLTNLQVEIEIEP
jgi:HlyD family secretion protein